MTVDARSASRADERLAPLERLEALCDPGSLDAAALATSRSRRMGEQARAGDGVIGGAGRVDGRPGLLLRAGPVVPRRLARRGARRHRSCACCGSPAARGAPVVGFIESGGARMQEGLAALGRLRRASSASTSRCRARVPQISVICGASRRRRLLLARADRLRRDDRAARRMFLTGPARRARGDGRGRRAPPSSAARKVHERNGVAHFVADDRRRRGAARRATCSTTCPQHAASARRAGAPVEPAPARPGRRRCRTTSARSTTCATSSAALVDGGRLLEIAPRWARNIVCGVRAPRRPPGRRRRQPAALPRRRARRRVRRRRRARFVRTCNAFGLPLVVLVDTPGFMPGTRAGAGAA